jgi:hypothetical protein
MQVECTLTDDEIAGLELHVRRTSPKERRRRRWSHAVIVAVFLLVGIVPLIVSGPTPNSLTAAVLIAFGLPLYVIVNLPWSQRALMRIGLRRQGPQLPLRVSLGAERLRYANAQAESLTRWNVIERIERTPTSLLLWFSEGRALLVPTRAFASVEAANAFENAARDWWSASNKGS